jgi:hypothetical protein
MSSPIVDMSCLWEKPAGSVIRHRICFHRSRQTITHCPGLSEAQQIDVIKKIETSDLPLNDIHILEGDPFTLLRNIGIRSEFIKGRRLRAIQMRNRGVVFQFKNGETMTLTKTLAEKTSNGMKFIGRQLLLRAAIDSRMKF